MDDCVALAKSVGKRIADELQVPVYLYEAAATRPDRKALPDVRRGEFEGLKVAIETEPERRPDFGPAKLHPTAGACIVGARPVLIAWNVNLGTDRKSTRLNSSHQIISYAVFCLKKKNARLSPDRA